MDESNRGMPKVAFSQSVDVKSISQIQEKMKKIVSTSPR